MQKIRTLPVLGFALLPSMAIGFTQLLRYINDAIIYQPTPTDTEAEALPTPACTFVSTSVSIDLEALDGEANAQLEDAPSPYNPPTASSVPQST